MGDKQLGSRTGLGVVITNEAVLVVFVEPRTAPCSESLAVILYQSRTFHILDQSSLAAASMVRSIVWPASWIQKRRVRDTSPYQMMSPRSELGQVSTSFTLGPLGLYILTRLYLQTSCQSAERLVVLLVNRTWFNDRITNRTGREQSCACEQEGDQSSQPWCR